MNREFRRMLQKQWRPLKDPIKEAKRQEMAATMTKMMINEALATKKAADQQKGEEPPKSA